MARKLPDAASLETELSDSKIEISHRSWADKPENLNIVTTPLAFKSYPLAILLPKLNGSANEGVFEQDGTPVEASSLIRGKYKIRGPKEGLLDKVARSDPSTVLFGGYYFNHFGHFISESLSRLWSYRDLSKIDKIVFLKGDQDRLGRSDVLKYFIPESDLPKVEIVSEATQYREIIIPDPGYVIRSSFNLNHWVWMRQVSDLIEKTKDVEKRSEPLYLSRSSQGAGKRVGFGEVDLETSLAESGFRVVKPEKMPFLDQVRLLLEHDTIVGLEGSQLHNLMFSRGGKRVIQLDYRPVNGNYVLIDKMLGNDASYIGVTFPKPYEGFQMSGGVTEPFIFEPQIAADHIANLTSWKVKPVCLSKETRIAFAMNWLQWWDRNVRAKEKAGKGHLFPISRYKHNLSIALSAI